VIALGEGVGSEELQNLPPFLRNTQWPTASATPELMKEAQRRLLTRPKRLIDHLDAIDAHDILETLIGEAGLPPPSSLVGIPLFYPKGQFPVLLGDRFLGRADDLSRIHSELSVMRGSPATSAAPTVRISAEEASGKHGSRSNMSGASGPLTFAVACSGSMPMRIRLI
jgi:hypothetical protein